MNQAALPSSDQATIDGVLAQFYTLCAVPHPSRGEAALTDALEARCRSHGWTTMRDAWNNLRVDVPPSPGLEHAPLLAFQGHTDMVCAIAPNSGYVPERDPIHTVIENGFLRSDGRSSLGADNNLGNAAVLYLMEQPVPHGPVRMFFTTAEEIGLQGAQQLDPAWLEGVRFLVNTDGFTLGRAVISSAGGRRETFTKKLHTVPRMGSHAFEIRLSGFLGGHSGYDINKGRANAVKLLALFLGELREKIDYDLAYFRGGHAHNAIPLEATAIITADRAFAVPLVLAVDRLQASMTRLFGRTDPNFRVDLAEVAPPERVWNRGSRDSTLDLVALLYSGVFAMHDSIPGQVSASANLGRLYVNADKEIEIGEFIRCAIDFSEEILGFQHARAAKLTGFHSKVNSYPGWLGDPDNPLAQAMGRVWQGLTGKKLEVTSVHVGLEPSVLGAKAPDMVMVSTGPDILDPHSTEERAPVASLPPYVRLLAGTMLEIAKRPTP